MVKDSLKHPILKWINSTPLSDGVLSFDNILTEAFRSVLKINREEAEIFAQRNKRNHWNNFVKYLKSAEENRLYPIARIIDNESRRFEYLPSWLSRVSQLRYKRLAGRLRLRPYIYKQIESMNDREYEAICCVACKACGATHFHITPKGNEGGIDFFALIETPRGFINCAGLNSIRIIGQAKKYKKAVPVAKIREFNESIEDVRRLSPNVAAHVPDWFSSKSSPIVGWLFGHSGFQSGSNSRAKMNGTMIFDSRTLTEMLVLSPNVGPGESGILLAQRLKDQCSEILKKGS